MKLLKWLGEELWLAVQVVFFYFASAIVVGLWLGIVIDVAK